MTMKETISRQDIKKRIEERLGNKAGTFMASLLDITGENKNLSLCDPNLVIKECMKAAALDLPINKNLGFAYVIPYNKSVNINGKWSKQQIPSFQMGYKGYIQLAIRTGQYRHLNAGVVYEGETMVVDRIRGTLTIEGEATSDKPTGYFCYMELINGFQKAIGWSAEKVIAHGKKHSKTFSDGPWQTDTEAMCLKTMIMQLVPKYGPLSIELTTAMSQDRSDVVPFDHAEAQISEHANQGDVIDIDSSNDVKESETLPDDELINGGEMTDAEKAEIMAMEAEAARQEQKEAEKEGPGF